MSDESGRLEIYVIPFDPLASVANSLASGRWQVSVEGGAQPRWSHNGKELFFGNLSGTVLYAVNIKAQKGKVESSNLRKVLDLPLHPAWDYYDVDLNDNVYMFHYVGRQSSALTVLLNWRPSAQ
jgi:hypothetical protein